MKKVLIALDYDPTAQKVAETGYATAKAMNAEVILLHVLSDSVFYSASMYDPIMGFGGFGNVDFMQSDVIANLKKTAQLFLNKAKSHLDDTYIQTLVKEGDFADSILEASKDLHADIIVMGSHSRKLLEQIVMGSTTEKVLNHTSIPLFIIPTKKTK